MDNTWSNYFPGISGKLANGEFPTKNEILIADVLTTTLRAIPSSRDNSKNQTIAEAILIYDQACENVTASKESLKTEIILFQQMAIRMRSTETSRDHPFDDDASANTVKEFFWMIACLLSPDVALLLRCTVPKQKVRALAFSGRGAVFLHLIKKRQKYISALRTTLDAYGLKTMWEDTMSSVKNLGIFQMPDHMNDRPAKRRRSSVEGSSLHAGGSPAVSSSETRNSVLDPETSRHEDAQTTHSTLSCRSSEDNNRPGQRSTDVENSLSKDALIVLPILFCLHQKSPISMLRRAAQKQKFWTENGDVGLRSPADSSLDDMLVAILGDDARLSATLQCLAAAGYIEGRQSDGNVTTKGLSYRPKDKAGLPEHRLQALRLVVHATVLHTGLDIKFGQTGKAQLHQLQHVHGYYSGLHDTKLATTTDGHNLVAALLAASQFGNLDWKEQALSKAERILDDHNDPSLRMSLCVRKVVFARLTGSQKTWEPISCTRNVKTKSISAEEALAIAEYYLERSGDLHKARDCLRMIAPMQTPPSQFEQYISPRRSFHEAKIARYTGNFEEASKVLEDMFSQFKAIPYGQEVFASTALNPLSHLAEIRCELGDIKGAIRAMDMVEKLTASSLGAKKFTRLRFVKAELQRRQGKYAEALETYMEVQEWLSIQSRDTTIEQFSFRLHVGQAQVYQVQENFREALGEWEEALKACDSCGWREGYAPVIVWYSMAECRIRLGDLQGGIEYWKRASERFKETGRQYWYAGLGTYWLDSIVDGIGKELSDKSRKLLELPPPTTSEHA